jgi:hypothetical protein
MDPKLPLRMWIGTMFWGTLVVGEIGGLFMGALDNAC